MGLSIGTKIDDLERLNGCVVCITLPNSIAFGAYYVKVVEDTWTFCE